MPTDLQVHAGTRRRGNVTEIIGRHEARSFDICRAGPLVAIHAHTSQGTVVITLGEREFVQKARGRIDSNGNPFRSLEEIRELAGEGPAPLTQMRRATEHGKNSERCAAAWEILRMQPELAAADIAASCGVQPNTFSQWISYHHRGELRQMRSAAGLPLKPARRPAGLPLVDVKAPVLKPGGKLL
jgi:hypothetical protein